MRHFRIALLLLTLVRPLTAAGPYLHGFDAIALLPPPPPLHSAEDVADRLSTLSVYTARTPEDVARGHEENKVKVWAFTPVVGPVFQPGRFPKLEALLKESESELKPVVDSAKNNWRRPRPFVADPAKFAEPGDAEKSPGYPSGHSTRGTFFALVLAQVFPEKAAAILAKGQLIGWTRVEIGVHTPLDIYAGRVLGRALFQKMMADPSFQADLAAAKAEVEAHP